MVRISKFLYSGIVCAAFATVPSAYAQQAIPIGSLPQEVEQAIKAAPLTQTLIPVSGEEKFSQQIIKADEIAFAAGATITLTNPDLPWVVIAARRFKFADPNSYSYVRRSPQFQSASGTQGSAGQRGDNDFGETNRTGNPGKPGFAGGPGGSGTTQQLPQVYIVTGDLTDPRGSIPAGLLNLVLSFRGIDGGDGGIGGTGGDGGDAGAGKKGATGLFDCHEGGGPGGTGGTAGQGGTGGPAGQGGNGADIIFVTTQKTYDVLSFTRINNIGGMPGTPGRAGNPGKPGREGAGAPSNGFCRSTRPGNPGSYPSPINLGPGNPSVEGAKGTVTAAILPTIEGLFP